MIKITHLCLSIVHTFSLETIEKARKSLQYAQQLTKMRVIEGAASGGLEIIPTRLGEVLEELKLLENMVLPFHGSSEEEYWKKFV